MASGSGSGTGPRVDLQGEFGHGDSRFSEAFDVFREADRKSGNNILSQFSGNTELVLSSTRDSHAYGSTSMHVYHRGAWQNVDSSATLDTWSRAPADSKVQIRVNVSDDLRTHEIHETLAHEMTVHAEQFASFASREIRDRTNSSSDVRRRWRRWTASGEWLNTNTQHGELVDNSNPAMRRAIREAATIVHDGSASHERTRGRSRRRRSELALDIGREWNTDRRQHWRRGDGSSRSPSRSPRDFPGNSRSSSRSRSRSR